jgi:serine/threonine-protein phosphatase 6 regulatory ankyrin repeat subunit B
VKEGHLDDLKQEIKAIDLLDLREDLSKIAVSAGQADALKFLINDKVDVNARYKNGNTLLMEAAQNNYFDVAKVLISKGANVRAKNKEDDNSSSSVNDSDSKTALSLAINTATRGGWKKTPERWIKIIKLLGNNGADLNEKDHLGQSLLFSAIVFNDIDLVKTLLSAVDTENILPTLISSYKNKTPLSNEQINDLRKSTIDVNERSKHTHGNTLLMYAIEEGLNEIVKLLLDYGANIEEENEEGDTTLGFVASLRRDKPKTIEMLLKHGAEINAQNNEGSTPLMNAAKNGNLKTIQVLLKHGAEINAQNNEGSTPLMKAVKHHKPNAAIFLINQGADPFIKNKKGETALSLAKQTLKELWADFVKDGAKKVIKKIKSHKGYKDFKKTQKASGD